MSHHLNLLTQFSLEILKSSLVYKSWVARHHIYVRTGDRRYIVGGARGRGVALGSGAPRFDAVLPSHTVLQELLSSRSVGPGLWAPPKFLVQRQHFLSPSFPMRSYTKQNWDHIEPKERQSTIVIHSGKRLRVLKKFCIQMFLRQNCQPGPTNFLGKSKYLPCYQIS